MTQSSYNKSKKNFKILLLYPNIQMSHMVPYSIGLFTALFRREGFVVDLFDTTFYVDEDNKNYETHYEFYTEFAWQKKSNIFKTNILDNFQKKIEEFDPNLIAISVVENTYSIARRIIQSLPEKMKKIPIVWGGVFATFAPQLILNDNVGDYVCMGEGDKAMIEFCNRLCEGKPTHNVQNFWVRYNGNIIKNKMGSLVDLENLPIPDYSLFPEHAMYRPMQGKVRRTIAIETQRGCPYTCTFCNSPGKVTLQKADTGQMFTRKRSIKKVREEIDFLHKKYNLELIYMIDDTFLGISEKRFDELYEMYLDFKIPFWMNTRCETMTERRAEKLEEMNLLRMNFGIEHGNPEYRRNILKRSTSNERMISAFQMTSGKKYVTIGDLIIGMPEENRKLVFDSIKFTRQLPKDVEKTGAFVFAPYHGTQLRELAVKKGYIKNPESICDITKPEESMLDQPQLPKQELIGLVNTAGLYQELPESKWKFIKKAEGSGKEAIELRMELRKDYNWIKKSNHSEIISNYQKR